MNCPTDGTTLLMSERHGVEVDYCPECRGIWLDRGELDKILDRVQQEFGSDQQRNDTQHRTQAPTNAPRYQEPRYQETRYQEPRYDDRRDSRYPSGQYRKKKSPFEFLGDFFE